MSPVPPGTESTKFGRGVSACLARIVRSSARPSPTELASVTTLVRATVGRGASRSQARTYQDQVPRKQSITERTAEGHVEHIRKTRLPLPRADRCLGGRDALASTPARVRFSFDSAATPRTVVAIEKIGTACAATSRPCRSSPTA